MRCGIEFYRHAFEHEVAANHAMLSMLRSVPYDKRSDPVFQRAVNIASHMAACRQCLLEVIKGETLLLGGHIQEGADFENLEARFVTMEQAWRVYLAQVDDAVAERQFVFADNGEKWSLSIEAQLFQFVGHAAYHRGQVVLLVDMLGGTTFDTDYIDWFTEHHPDGWSKCS